MWVCTITVVYDEFFCVMELLMLINFTDQEVLEKPFQTAAARLLWKRHALASASLDWSWWRHDLMLMKVLKLCNSTLVLSPGPSECWLPVNLERSLFHKRDDCLLGWNCCGHLTNKKNLPKSIQQQAVPVAGSWIPQIQTEQSFLGPEASESSLTLSVSGWRRRHFAAVDMAVAGVLHLLPLQGSTSASAQAEAWSLSPLGMERTSAAPTSGREVLLW